MTRFVFLFSLCVMISSLAHACPAPPVGSANDTVLQMKPQSGTAGLGPSSVVTNIGEGTVVYDDANDQLVVCDGTNWQPLGGGASTSLYSLYTNQTGPTTTAGTNVAWRDTRTQSTSATSWTTVRQLTPVAGSGARINYKAWDTADGTNCSSRILVNGVSVFSTNHGNGNNGNVTTTTISFAAGQPIVWQLRNTGTFNACGMRDIEIATASGEFVPLVDMPADYQYLTY